MFLVIFFLTLLKYSGKYIYRKILTFKSTNFRVSCGVRTEFFGTSLLPSLSKILPSTDRQIVFPNYTIRRYTNIRCPTFQDITAGTVGKRLRWSRGSVLPFGTQVHGFKPGRRSRIFQGEKILTTPSFGREVKPFVPCRRFTACKRSLNVTWKSGIFRQNLPAIHRPSSSSFHY